MRSAAAGCARQSLAFGQVRLRFAPARDRASLGGSAARSLASPSARCPRRCAPGKGPASLRSAAAGCAGQSPPFGRESPPLRFGDLPRCVRRQPAAPVRARPSAGFASALLRREASLRSVAPLRGALPRLRRGAPGAARLGKGLPRCARQRPGCAGQSPPFGRESPPLRFGDPPCCARRGGLCPPRPSPSGWASSASLRRRDPPRCALGGAGCAGQRPAFGRVPLRFASGKDLASLGGSAARTLGSPSARCPRHSHAWEGACLAAIDEASCARQIPVRWAGVISASLR
ncbi:hypothetical protein M2167_004885 [Streptomyces sp. SPB4]|nr:hypothetical protein [Streptomyces sp. SPB4]